jgi:hypothetical protein
LHDDKVEKRKEGGEERHMLRFGGSKSVNVTVMFCAKWGNFDQAILSPNRKSIIRDHMKTVHRMLMYIGLGFIGQKDQCSIEQICKDLSKKPRYKGKIQNLFTVQ